MEARRGDFISVDCEYLPIYLKGLPTNNRGSDGGKGEAGVDRPKGDDRIFDCLHKPPASALLDSLAGPNFIGSPPRERHLAK